MQGMDSALVSFVGSRHGIVEVNFTLLIWLNENVGNLKYFLYLYIWISITYQVKQKITLMITDDKITEIFYATDEFSKKFDEKIANMPLFFPISSLLVLRYHLYTCHTLCILMSKFRRSIKAAWKEAEKRQKGGRKEPTAFLRTRK